GPRSPAQRLTSFFVVERKRERARCTNALIRELRSFPERQRTTITAVCLPAALAFLVVALTFVIFAFNVIDAGTFAYLGVPIGILVVAAVSGRWGGGFRAVSFPGVCLPGLPP